MNVFFFGSFNLQDPQVCTDTFISTQFPLKLFLFGIQNKENGYKIYVNLLDGDENYFLNIHE